MKRSGRVACAVLALGALGLLLFGWLPAGALRWLADLAWPGHPLRALELPAFNLARRVCGVIGLAGLALCALAPLRPAWTARVVAALRAALARFCSDARAWGGDLRAARLPGGEALALAAITLVGAAVRVIALFRPMEYDESYTVVAFATRPLWGVLSDYSLPNNHVFHTLWVHFSWLLFGLHTWSVRLPACVAGVLLIGAVYGLARRLYGPRSALLAAGLAAAAPLMVGYSANARGYSLLGLFTVLIFWLGAYLKDHANTAAWLALALLSALGFFTVPIMLYPFGMLFTWLGLSFLAGEMRHTYSFARIVKYGLISGLLTGALTLLFYTPVLVGTGWHALTGNVFVQAEPWGRFFSEFGWRMRDAFASWTSGVADGVVGLGVLGFVLALALHGRICRARIPIQLAALLWLALVFPIQRPLLLTKVWLYFYPLLLIWTAAGWGGVLDWFSAWRGAAWARFVTGGLTGAALLGLALGAGLLAQADLPYLRGTRAWMEDAALYLSANAQPDDVVLIDYPIDAQFMFYARVHGLPDGVFREYETRVYRDAWVLVDPVYQQSVESVLADRPVGQAVDAASLRPVKTIGPLEIYRGQPAVRR